MKVCNMLSSKGNKVPNQFIINHKGKEYFQSYSSIIAKKVTQWFFNYEKKETKIFLDEKFWDYSTTTGKYRNQFLNEGIAETRKKIKSGIYVLTNLN